MVRICNCKKNEFIKILEEEKIVCICAGEGCVNFIEEYDLKDKIEYVVDNKGSGNLIVDGNAINIVPFFELKYLVNHDKILILTSLLYADKIIEQLDSIPELDNVRTFIPQLVEMDDKSVDLPTWTSKEKIPKKIHYF